jgi:hypothetical protein
MPPRLIMSRQFGLRKGEQFTPELIWQSIILTLIFLAHLTKRGETLVNMQLRCGERRSGRTSIAYRH